MSTRVLNETLKAVDFYRRIILDAVEPEFSGFGSWGRVRNTILHAFGDRGLSGRLREIHGIESSEIRKAGIL